MKKCKNKYRFRYLFSFQMVFIGTAFGYRQVTDAGPVKISERFIQKSLLCVISPHRGVGH